MEDDPSLEYTSRIQELEIPEFRSLIPEHLIEDLNPKERWIVETMSRLEQQGDWLIREIVSGRKNLIDLDTRLHFLTVRIKPLESWRRGFKSVWVYASALALMVITAVITTLAERWFGK